MTITVEDGSIVASANSYASYADLVAYGLIRGITITATQADGEVFLIEAMDALYGRPWQGQRVDIDQSLEWPRNYVYRDGFLLDYDEIPIELKYGQLALALAAHEGIDLMPDHAALAKGPVVEERVEGAVTVKYGDTGRTLDVAVVSDAEALLRVLEKRQGLTVIRS